MAALDRAVRLHLARTLRAGVRRRRRQAAPAAHGAPRALYGSVERFFGVLIEHYAGAFPVWLSPVQVVVVPIGEKHHAYAIEVGEKLKAAGVRVHVDVRNEKMNAKIREHAMQKVPFQLVVGDKEMEAGEVNVRVRGQEKGEGSVKTEAFVERVKGLIENKAATL